MGRSILIPLCVLGLVYVAPARADEVPEEAKRAIEEHQKEAAKIREKAEQDIKADRDKLLERLKDIQDKYTKDGKLDQAVAVRDQIAAIRAAGLNPAKDPGTLGGLRDQVGKVLYFEVTGDKNSSCYGSGPYTDDTPLKTAAVHAGVLKDGQKGVVKVTILGPGQDFRSSSQNGVSSSSYGSWGGSYKVEKP